MATAMDYRDAASLNARDLYGAYDGHSGFKSRRHMKTDKRRIIPHIRIVNEQGILVQEVDEGQPCLDCGDKCPGFTLHAWRNICNNCRCPREDHDIYHEDFVNVRDRLGWETPEDPLLRCNKERTLQAGYTWVPPGLSSEKIEEYMDQLDNNKIPKIGTAGEKYRDLQLVYQLPKQDLAEDFSKHLKTAGQHKAFNDFRHMRDATAMDIGILREYVTEDTSCAGCDGEIEGGDMAVFAPNVNSDICWHPACFTCHVCEELLVDLTYCHKEGHIYCERHYAEEIRPRCAACDEVTGHEVPSFFRRVREAEAVCGPGGRKLERRGSIPHLWSEASVESPHSPAAASVPEPPKQLYTPPEQLISRYSHILASKAIRPDPAKLTSGFFLVKVKDVPLIFSGEYTKAMDQDWHSGHFCCWNCDMSLTGHRYILREEHPFCIKCYENLFANTCEECKTPIGTDSKDLSYKDKHWHEACFKCCDCQASLVDQPFASKDEKLYCADCHDNNFAARCDGCGNIFRAGMKKFEFRGKQWHEECFCCNVCKQPIGNKRFIPRDAEFVCVPCYEEQFAQRCQRCQGVINKGGITYKGTPFHRECFQCTNCQKVLAGEKFTSREDQPYCADCFGELFAKKCCRCTKPITGLGGTKFISFDDRHWHSDCFSCYRCNISLVGKGFLTNVEDILCPDCGRAI